MHILENITIILHNKNKGKCGMTANDTPTNQTTQFIDVPTTYRSFTN